MRVPTGMVAARAVTGLALQLPVAKRRFRIVGIRVLGTKDRKDHLVVMALETTVRALTTVVRRIRILSGHNRGRGDDREGHRHYRTLPQSHFT
jgi:hypothetical protein